MNCPNCGAENINGSSFCIKCGANLKEMQPTTNNINNAPLNNQISQSTIQNQNIQQPMNNQPMQHQTPQPINSVQTAQPVSVNTTPLNYLMYLIAILIKPFQCFKEEESKLSNGKTSIILTLIVTVVMILSNLIKTIVSTVRVASYNWTDGYTYSWQWDNLKNIKWLEVIGKNFLIYAGIILAITIVFYFGSLVVKKQLSFIKSLSISATSVIPAVCGAMILAPILGMVWSPLSIVFTIIGLVYSLIILYEIMNNELNLEKDKKIYFNLICFGILIIAGYYAYMRLFMSSVNAGLDNILDLFK